MKNLKRIFKNIRQLWRAMLLLGCLLFVFACSNDDGEKSFNPLYDFTQLNIEEQQTNSVEDGLTITRDESGRVSRIEAYLVGEDNLEKLMSAPESFDDIKHLFPLSDGNEIRLINNGEINYFEEKDALNHSIQYFEQYQQFYQDIPIYNAMGEIFYFMTNEGKRMSYGWFGPFVDVKNLKTTPDISETKARQTLANQLDEKRDDSWPCQMYIKEYSTRKDGKIQRDVRLIYAIDGPLAPMLPDVWYCFPPHYYAEIDAHTGQLLFITY